MIILDKPYVSKFLAETIVNLDIPVLDSEELKDLNLNNSFKLFDSSNFITEYKGTDNPKLYCNSENSIEWISTNLDSTSLPKKIELFKNKVKFRDLISPLYPNFFYKEVSYNDLEDLDLSIIKRPFIIKPSVGFYSYGVFKVNEGDNWLSIIEELKDDISKGMKTYPVEVISNDKFIIEEVIEGTEYAIDIYYNDKQEPVILNIMEHIFSSSDDLGDRCYFTSKEIINSKRNLFNDFLVELGKLADLKNFPMHIEIRVDNEDNFNIIEVNPMRFAGWCLTDLAYYAYNINIYDYFFNNKKPNWDVILEEKDDIRYSFVIGEVNRTISLDNILSINYDKFYNRFKKPLGLRKINYKKFPIFAFIFLETKKGDWKEIEDVLVDDLKSYINLK